MTTTTVDFSKNALRFVGRQYVYFRRTWLESWTLYQDIHCTAASWATSPTLPAATLVREHGFVKTFGSNVYANLDKVDPIGYFVKIVMETDLSAGEHNTWYGIVTDVEDEHQGIVDYQGAKLATGVQTMYCLGLEKILDTEVIAESWADTGNATPDVFQLPITFNRGGRPNRNDRLFPGSPSYVFEGQSLNPGGTLRPTAQWWTTTQIVKYLLHWVTPKASFRTRTARIPFELSPVDLKFLPAFDRPEIEQEGKTVLAILNQLIDRRKLRSFHFEVDEAVTPNRIRMRVDPWNDELITLETDDADSLWPNTNLIKLLYDYSQETTAIIRKSRIQKYDRIIVRGARRTSTATWVVDTGYLTPIWTSAEETRYEAAASGITGYATWDLMQQQQRNAEVRNASELSAVFSWFKLPDTWNGLTVEVGATTTHPVFLQADGHTVEKQYIHDVVFESFVPLYEHVDYSGSAIADESVDDPPANVYRQPFAVFKIPTDARWIMGDAISMLADNISDPVGDGTNFRWSATVAPQQDTRTLEVRVSGEPQHVIAFTDWHTEKLDEDRELGDWDYRSKKMAITATLRDNRYAEGKYPDDGTGDTSLIDAKYGYVIYAGEAFRQDYVVPGTVVDVDSDGTLLTSTGGYVTDDTDLLNEIARVTYEWWSVDRMILTLATKHLTSKIQPGYYIQTIGQTWRAEGDGEEVPENGHYESVGTVVSEVRINWPRLDGNQLASPTMQIVTGAGELDPMTLMPREPRSISRMKARVRR